MIIPLVIAMGPIILKFLRDKAHPCTLHGVMHLSLAHGIKTSPCMSISLLAHLPVCPNKVSHQAQAN